MAIVIKKRHAPEMRTPAPLVEGAPKVEASTSETVITEKTKEETLGFWKNQPPIGAKPKPCPYCGHSYILPCEGDQHKGCQNWQLKQQLQAKKEKS